MRGASLFVWIAAWNKDADIEAGHVKNKEDETMWEVLAGTAAGIAAAAAGIFCYRRGLLDGRAKAVKQEEAEAENALIRRYEAIMDYDPYGERV